MDPRSRVRLVPTFDPPDLPVAVEDDEVTISYSMPPREDGDLSLAEFDPSKHKRWPKGTPGGLGGKFRQGIERMVNVETRTITYAPMAATATPRPRAARKLPDKPSRGKPVLQKYKKIEWFPGAAAAVSGEVFVHPKEGDLTPPGFAHPTAVLKSALAPIDRVHRVPEVGTKSAGRYGDVNVDFPRVRSGYSRMGGGKAAYVAAPLSGFPPTIIFAPEVLTDEELPDHKFYAIHEFGHFLDNRYVGYFSKERWINFASEAYLPREHPTTKVIHAAEDSELVALLNQAKTDGYYEWTRPDGEKQLETTSPEFVEYALGRAELFACAYAQYIAIRSNDAEMLDSVKRRQQANPMYARVWQDEDFAPIAAAMDEFISDLGWGLPPKPDTPEKPYWDM